MEMRRGETQVVLVVDDDESLLGTVTRLLSRRGYGVATATSGEAALAWLASGRPDLILLDVIMPGMDGYALCEEIRGDPQLARVPLVFVTVRESEADMARAMSVGGSGYLEKPFEAEAFLAMVEHHLPRSTPAADAPSSTLASTPGDGPSSHPGQIKPVSAFLDWLREEMPELGDDGPVQDIPPSSLFDWAGSRGLSEARVTQLASQFTGLPLVSTIGQEDVRPGVLAIGFCRSRLVVPVRSTRGRRGIVVANPFDWEIEEAIQRTDPARGPLDVMLAEPAVIRTSLATDSWEPSRGSGQAQPGMALDTEARPGKDHPVAAKAIELLASAARDRASDIHFEPKEDRTMVRVRIDGDMQDLEEITKFEAVKLISRFKAIAGMNIAERRRPQDNSVSARIDGRLFKLRLATSSTTFGESMVIRLLEPSAEPLTLEELGMSPKQASLLTGLAGRSQGLILFVGPTGSGKSTTVYSLLSQVDTRRRSLISVEDPVEYRIPFANQQQVNDRVGITFDVLLRSAVRQDPDILLLGEVRDLNSAKAAMDFAASGHLTLTSMHSSNATTSIFRLERLGISRTDMSEALIGIVAQKLMKRLCAHCKQTRRIRPEEAEILRPFTQDIPAFVSDPGGCPECRSTGFHGREGLFEIIPVDAAMGGMVREGRPIHELRSFARARGDLLMAEQGLQKLRDQVFTVRQVYESVLAEEGCRREAGAEVAGHPTDLTSAKTSLSPAPEAPLPGYDSGPQRDEPASILVVDDDPITRTLLGGLLSDGGYRVVLADDGADALLRLGTVRCDLILCDLNMPNLDGFKLLEILQQRGLEIPVIFLSAETRPEAEVKGLDLGAADYIRKPIQGPVILQRIRRSLAGPSRQQNVLVTNG